MPDPARPSPTNAHGHRLTPSGGPRLRSDIVDVYIFQRSSRPPAKLAAAAASRPRSSMDSDAGGSGAGSLTGEQVYFLQLLRAGAPLAGTWHPVMGHIESGETAVECAKRELREEVGLKSEGGSLLGLWALEQVHPFFIAELDAIVLSPRFAAEVPAGWSPTIDDEHSDFRWVSRRDVPTMFMWPGQQAACREIVEGLVPEGSLMREQVRVG
ncbi:MAG: NUDIX domain-containing protein [Phycisphaerales bacterium]|nr:NUDIX domain-containing protein [Phycisphaerales bacterium]